MEIKCDLSSQLVTYTKGIAGGRQNSDNTESIVHTFYLSLSLCNLPLDTSAGNLMIM